MIWALGATTSSLELALMGSNGRCLLGRVYGPIKRGTHGEVLVEVLVSDRMLAATTQQTGSHGATRSAREWPQAYHPPAWAQPTRDQDPVFRSIPDERGRGYTRN